MVRFRKRMIQLSLHLLDALRALKMKIPFPSAS